MLKSHPLVFSDFETQWYKHWAKGLKQTEKGKKKYALRANKFWQNAVMTQALFERGVLEDGYTGIGFGVGKERLPALFASMGVKITATDQDFSKSKAKQWDNDQLAHGRFSLNEDEICDPSTFNKNVEFDPVDMTNIQKRFYGKYDFLWSNCALGHLGSINEGLKFIEKSLECLKPGGWAVHTTELNILSDDKTVDSGDTVVFRISDIYELSSKLTKMGYECEPLQLTLGDSTSDAKVALRPAWGNDYSKILIGGHIATQIILIIHKPIKTKKSSKENMAIHEKAYKKNQSVINHYWKSNDTLRLIKKSADASPDQYIIKPTKSKLSVKANQLNKPLIIKYKNKSNLALMGIYEALYDIKPIVLATANPVNRKSELANKNWFSPNRPAVTLVQKINSEWVPVGFIPPKAKFGFAININPKSLKNPNSEFFTVVQEGGDIIANSSVKVSFKP